MKREFIFLGIILLSIGVGFSLSFSLNAPSTIASGKPFATDIILTGNADKVDIGVILPNGFKEDSWQVYGLPANNVNYTVEKINGQNMLHFQLKGVKSKASIQLKLIAYNDGLIKYVMTYKEGNSTSMAYKTEDIKLNHAVCGNGICEPGENANNCPVDCGSQKGTYLGVIAIAIVAAAGIGYWIYRRWKYVH